METETGRAEIRACGEVTAGGEKELLIVRDETDGLARGTLRSSLEEVR